MTDDALKRKFPEDAARVIEAFGGIRPMAAKLGIAATTVQGWKKRGAIPEARQADILRAAQEAGVDFDSLPVAVTPAPSTSAPEPKPVAPPPVELNIKAEEEAPPPAPETLRPPHVEHIGRISRAADEEEQEEQSRLRATEKLRETPQFFSESIPPELIERIRSVETRSSRIAALIAAIFVGAAICFTVIVLWPTARKVDEYDNRLTAVEGTVMHIGEAEDGAAGRAPATDTGWVAELDQRMDDWKREATAVKSDVETAIGQAKNTVNEIAGTESGPLSERIAKLEEQVQEISGSSSLGDLLARLQGYAGTVQGQGTLDDLVLRLRDLAMGANGSNGEFDAALDSARASDPALNETFEGVAPGDLKAAAMLVGLTNLRSALARDNVPFENDLDLLLNLVGDDNPDLRNALLRIAPQAKSGVLTSAGLSKELRGLTGDVVAASLNGEDVSFEERARARLNEVLQIEKKGTLVTGTDTQAKISQAQALLDRGDIQGAIGELQGLDGPAAQAAQPWIGQAEATQAAEQLGGLIDNFMRVRTIGHGAKYTTGFKGLSGFVPAPPVIHDEGSGVFVMPQGRVLPGTPPPVSP